MYCDVSVDEDGQSLIFLQRPTILTSEIDESYHVCHKGYISIFPFLLGLLPPESPHLGAILDLVRNPDELWSPYGIRSLSLSHPLFGQGENYWRGPIWVQMNYLALSALYKVCLILSHLSVLRCNLSFRSKKTYIPNPGPYQKQARQIYDELRTNIISNVYRVRRHLEASILIYL